MGRTTRFSPCALAEMGRCLAPCDGRVGLERYAESVRSLLSSLSTPGGLLAALEVRMRDLAAEERFEEASLARDRLRALAEALVRARTDGWLLGARDVRLTDPGGHAITLRGGTLADDPVPVPCPRDRADELAAVRSWLGRNRITLVDADPPLAEPVDGGLELSRMLTALRAVDRRGP